MERCPGLLTTYVEACTGRTNLAPNHEAWRAEPELDIKASFYSPCPGTCVNILHNLMGWGALENLQFK